MARAGLHHRAWVTPSAAVSRLDDAGNHVYRRAGRVSDARSAAPHSPRAQASDVVAGHGARRVLATSHGTSRRNRVALSAAWLATRPWSGVIHSHLASPCGGRICRQGSRVRAPSVPAAGRGGRRVERRFNAGAPGRRGLKPGNLPLCQSSNTLTICRSSNLAMHETRPPCAGTSCFRKHLRKQ